jgi:tetratricopeptide (TPR) repeat protein
MQDYNDFDLHSTDSILQEGLDLLESDHFEEALGAFDFVLGRQPSNADALFHRGIALVNLKRLEEAVASFRRAIEIAPTESLFHMHCGYALMLSGQMDAALEHFDYALDVQPDNVQTRVFKACALAEKRNLSAASQLLLEVLREHPDNADALFNLATISAATGKDVEALEYFDRLLAMNPNHVEAMSRKSVLHMNRREYDEAIRYLRQITALAPANLAAWHHLLDIHASRREWPAVAAHATQAIEGGNETSDLYLVRARALLEQRRVEDAITDLARARELDPRNAEVHYLLARALSERGRLRHAVTSVGRALQLNSSDKRFLLLKASLHHQLGEYDLELQYLNLLLNDSPTDYQLVRMKADNQVARGRLSDAANTISRFLAQEPDHPRALLLMASLADQLENHGVARDFYEKLFRVRPVSARAYLSYSSFLMRHSETAKAAEILEAGAAAYPGYAALETARAAALQSLGQHEQCARHLTAFLTKSRQAPEAHWILGKSLFALGRYREALESFQKARKQDTQCNGNSAPSFRFLVAEAYTLHNLHRTHDGIRLLEHHISQFERYGQEYHEVLGELYEFTKAYAKAQAVYAHGLRKYPQSPTLHYRLARAAAAHGKKKVALRHLAAALALDANLHQAAATEPAFHRYSLSLTMNRLLGFRFVRRRMKMLALYSGWVIALLLLQLLLGR